MPNKYEKEVIKLKSQRDKSILGEISLIFDVIQGKTKALAMEITERAGDNTEYFQERNRAEKFATQINEELRPDYLKKDNFSKNVYIEEYRTAYIQSLYTTVNLGIDEGYLVKLPRYTAKQFKRAINYPLSKLMNNNKMKTARSVDIEQLYTTIVSGVESGLSLPNINKSIDIALGYRDSQTGLWIKDKALRKGQTYKTMRTLRTEVLRMRATAETDQWVNAQDIVPSKLQLIATLDNRVRSQSANMDLQIANKEGKFLYPEVGYKFAHRSGLAKFDVNDRETVITLDEEFPPESRIQRDKNGNNKVLPFESFKSYSEKLGMKTNKWGQVLFP